jgi:hypothetical protein
MTFIDNRKHLTINGVVPVAQSTHEVFGLRGHSFGRLDARAT